MTEGSSIPVPNSTQFLSRRMQLQKYSTDDLLTMTTVTTGADSLNHDRSTDCYSQSNKHPINCTTTTKPTGEDEGLAWSWSSSSPHDPRQRNYTCYKTRHNLSIRTYDYWYRPSEWRLSSEYSVLILFTIRILYQYLRKLCRSEIFSLFLNLFVSYALLLQETSWMDSRPHRPPASITSCLLQKLRHFTRWLAPGLGARERSIAQGRIRRNLLWSRQSALAVRATPACSVLSSGRSLEQL